MNLLGEAMELLREVHYLIGYEEEGYAQRKKVAELLARYDASSDDTWDQFKQALKYELDQREDEWERYKDPGVQMDAAIDIVVEVVRRHFALPDDASTSDGGS